MGTVSNGREALRLVEELRPHSLLTDVVMPVMGGVELCAELRARFPVLQVVVPLSKGAVSEADWGISPPPPNKRRTHNEPI